MANVVCHTAPRPFPLIVVVESCAQSLLLFQLRL